MIYLGYERDHRRPKRVICRNPQIDFENPALVNRSTGALEGTNPMKEIVVFGVKGKRVVLLATVFTPFGCEACNGHFLHSFYFILD